MGSSTGIVLQDTRCVLGLKASHTADLDILLALRVFVTCSGITCVSLFTRPLISKLGKLRGTRLVRSHEHPSLSLQLRKQSSRERRFTLLQSW